MSKEELDYALDKREQKHLEQLTERYKKLQEPTAAGKAVEKAKEKLKDLVPDKAKDTAEQLVVALTEKEIVEQVMRHIQEGFSKIQEELAEYTISSQHVIDSINKEHPNYKITSLDDISQMRSYHLSPIYNKYKKENLAITVVQAGGIGALGLPGLAPNIALNILLGYRAVQQVALIYGFDAKNDPSEQAQASQVYINSLSPHGVPTSELGTAIEKLMAVGEVHAAKKAVAKGWTAAAERGGLALLIAQIRALANKAAENALKKAGKRGIEQTLLKGALEGIGEKLTQKAVSRSIPFVSAAICATLDTRQMSKILNYAEIYYAKRFLLEKEERALAQVTYES